jgi:uncharacterized protein (DUF433 family)
MDAVMTWVDRITFNGAVMGGKPCIRHMRVTVGTIVGLIAAGRSDQEILKAYPYLEPDDVRAAQIDEITARPEYLQRTLRSICQRWS